MSGLKEAKFLKIRRLFKRSVSSLLYPLQKLTALFYRPRGFRVLLYHSVDDAADARDALGVKIPLARFYQQMEFLQRKGYNICALPELIATTSRGLPLPPRALAITFDDGYKDNLTNAVEVLRKFGFPATFFVSTDYIDAKSKRSDNYWENWEFLSWPDIKSLQLGGFTIGSHGCSHRALTALPESERSAEIKTSKERIEACLGEAIDLFSYPHGAKDALSRELLRKEGFAAACSSIYGYNSGREDRYQLRRIEIAADDDLFEFEKKLIGCYDWVRLFQKSDRTARC